MKYSSISPHVVLAAAIAIAVPLSGQQQIEKTLRQGTIASEQMTKLVELSKTSPATPDTPPPLWTHSSMASRDGRVYSTFSIGASPFAAVKTSTHIPIVIVPLAVSVNGVTLDPTAAVTNSCVRPAWNGKTPVEVLLQSPIFTPTDWTMNGQDVGNGQYIDAFQRAQYWSLVQGSNYHTVLDPVTVAAQTVPASAIDPEATTATSACVAQSGGAPDQITLGRSDTGLLTPWIEGTLIPQLRSQGVIESGQLVYFLLYNTTFSDATGFHSYVGTQTYAVSLINGSDSSSPDVKSISHIIGDWMNDPFPTESLNRTPGWVAPAANAVNSSTCQTNSAIGDPTASDLFPVTMPNGLMYHPQELTFYSWFHGAPSIGAGGLYSNNATLAIDAGAVCHAAATSLLTITTTALNSAVLGTAFSQTLTATGGTAPYTWSVLAGRLPSGLTLNAATGVISGIPTGPLSQSLVSFQVTDASSPAQTASAMFILTISAGPTAIQITTVSLSNGAVGVQYAQTLTATGGQAPYAWQLVAGTLPSGLALSSGTGLISGTPLVAVTATPLTFEVTDSNSPPQFVTGSFTLTIAPPPLVVTTIALPNGTVGAPYSQTLMAANGSGVYTWQLIAGALPPGLTLNPNGVISGTPTAYGTFTPILFRVNDSGPPPQIAMATLPITILPAPPQITTVSLPDGTVNVPYSATLTATGGTLPYTWSVNTGSLPPGLTLNSATGVIGGTPTTSGIFTPLTFKLVDLSSPPQSATANLPITIHPPPLKIQPITLPNCVVGSPCTITLVATGGTPPYTWSFAGTLPPGLTLNPATGVISGTPTTAGTFTLTFTVTDAGTPPQTATTASMTLTVLPQLLITSAGTFTCIQTQPCSVTPTAVGGVPPDTWSYTGTLPAGLSFNASTGTISGTPTVAVASPGTQLILTVKDSGTPQQTATGTFWLIVKPFVPLSITTTSLPNGIVGQPYTATLQATGGTPPYTPWSVNTGSLPVGLTLNPATGVISGTPTTAGTSTSLIFKVLDSGSPQQSATSTNLPITIIPVLTITNPSSSPMTITCTKGQPCSFAAAATGGVPPYTWSSGALPIGLTLNPATGLISGTPTALVASPGLPVTLQVTDSGTPQQTASVVLNIIVIQPIPLQIVTTALATGTVGTPYSSQLQAIGGTTPYTWSLAGGRLPSGLSLDPATGIVSGNPSVPQDSGYLIFQVTDSGSPQQSVTAYVLITIVSTP